MSRRAARTRRCTAADAAKRLAQAEAFANLAELEPESRHGPTRSAAVSNAVLAGIAAADAICCRRLGRHSSAEDHQQALELLEQVTGPGTRATAYLGALLSIKNKAQYEGSDPSASEARRAIRSMRALIDLARSEG